jgi:hypothetical protein
MNAATATPPAQGSLVASFVFVDLVAFSKKSTSEQFAQKEILTDILQRNIRLIPAQQYMIKDTGDGAWMGFVASPEHALYTALALMASCRPQSPDSALAREDLRVGLNLGAVRQTLDLESRPNFVGDGINVAKRVMDFAEPGQITASRSYFDAVVSLDSSFPRIFSQIPTGSDKHGREHELYQIVPSMSVLQTLRAQFEPGMKSLAEPAPEARGKRGLVIGALAAAVVAGAAIAYFAGPWRGSPPSAPGTASAPSPSPTAKASPPPPAVAEPAQSTPPAAIETPSSTAAASPPAAEPKSEPSQAAPAATGTPTTATRNRRSSNLDAEFGPDDEPTFASGKAPADVTRARRSGQAGVPRSPEFGLSPDGMIPTPGERPARSRGNAPSPGGGPVIQF